MAACELGQVTGDIKYNGESLDSFIVKRTAAHVEQLDHHLANMTVHETLEFSYRCCHHLLLFDCSKDSIGALAVTGVGSLPSVHFHSEPAR